MPDPITTIVTTAVEHVSGAAVAVTALKAARSFLAKVVGPAVEEVGEIGRDYIKGWRAKNGSQTLLGADKLLVEVGREPQAVPLKTLLPLLDAASLEEEVSMAARWASLLANAADPAQRVQVQPGFAEVLRQLTPTDARVLEIAADIKPINNPGGLPGFVQVTSLNKRIEDVPATTLAISIGNLTRLGVCLSAASQPALNHRGSFLAPPPKFNTVGPGFDFIQLTPFGRAFLAAVTPPAPQSS
jgi:hypothetical protein